MSNERISISMRETLSSSRDLWMAFLSLTALSRISSASFVSINLLTAFSTNEALTNALLCPIYFRTKPNLSTSEVKTVFSWLVRVGNATIAAPMVYDDDPLLREVSSWIKHNQNCWYESATHTHTYIYILITHTTHTHTETHTHTTHTHTYIYIYIYLNHVYFFIRGIWVYIPERL